MRHTLRTEQLGSDVIHGHRRAHRETLQGQRFQAVLCGRPQQHVEACWRVSIFVEKRIAILSAGEFQQEFGQKALQHIMRNHPLMKVMAMKRNSETDSEMVYCSRLEPLSPRRSVVIHLFQDVVQSTQYMSVADHVYAEQSEHMANHFQQDQCGNWKEFSKQPKSLRDFQTTVLNQLKESANEHGPLGSDVFGFDRQDQESTRASSSEPLKVRHNSSDARQDKNLVGAGPLVITFTCMMLTRSGSTEEENTPTPTKKGAPQYAPSFLLRRAERRRRSQRHCKFRGGPQ